MGLRQLSETLTNTCSLLSLPQQGRESIDVDKRLADLTLGSKDALEMVKSTSPALLKLLELKQNILSDETQAPKLPHGHLATDTLLREKHISGKVLL